MTEWHLEQGWGVIESPSLPAGEPAWAHFSAVHMEGYRYLSVGQAVEFTYERADQDGYRYGADAVMPEWGAVHLCRRGRLGVRSRHACSDVPS